MKKVKMTMITMLISLCSYGEGVALNHINDGLESYLNLDLSQKRIVLSGTSGAFEQRNCRFIIDNEIGTLKIEDTMLDSMTLDLKKFSKGKGKIIKPDNYDEGLEYKEVQSLEKSSKLKSRRYSIHLGKDVYNGDITEIIITDSNLFAGVTVENNIRRCRIDKNDI